MVDGMNCLKVTFKKNLKLTEEDIDSLIYLKQQFWKYDYHEQKKWLHENIREDDYHIFINNEKQLLAYLNAVRVDVMINHKEYNMLGVGNVCVDKNMAHIGLGSLLLSVMNLQLKYLHMQGILLCKRNLIDFYKESNWKLIESTSVKIGDIPFNNCVMVYNPKSEWFGHTINKIVVSRNF